jgi:hypothetical protein
MPTPAGATASTDATEGKDATASPGTAKGDDGRRNAEGSVATVATSMTATEVPGTAQTPSPPTQTRTRAGRRGPPLESSTTTTTKAIQIRKFHLTLVLLLEEDLTAMTSIRRPRGAEAPTPTTATIGGHTSETLGH